MDQQPPPMAVVQEAYTAHSGHGSVGPVIGVLAVIAVLGVIAGMIGRLCSGRRVMGHGQYYDFEGWVERKCSSCLDGTIDPPRPPRPVTATTSGDGVPVAMPVEMPEEMKEEEDEEQEEEEEQTQQQQNSHAATSESRHK